MDCLKNEFALKIVLIYCFFVGLFFGWIVWAELDWAVAERVCVCYLITALILLFDFSVSTHIFFFFIFSINFSFLDWTEEINWKTDGVKENLGATNYSSFRLVGRFVFLLLSLHTFRDKNALEDNYDDDDHTTTMTIDNENVEKNLYSNPHTHSRIEAQDSVAFVSH